MRPGRLFAIFLDMDISSNGETHLLRLARRWREMAGDKGGAHHASFTVCADQLEAAVTALLGRQFADPVRLIVEIMPELEQNSADVAKDLTDAWEAHGLLNGMRITGRIDASPLA